jgi:xanthine dehydrogenase YagS FAD-binding subunit
VRLPIAEVLEQDALEAQDGSSGALITAVLLGPPLAEERTAYVRASNRALAEWALAEVSVRLRRHEDRLDFVRVAAGGVAPTPLRLTAVEDALIAEAIEPELLAKAAKLAREGAKPLPQTGYKLDLLEAAVLDALEQALGAPPAPSGFTQLTGASTNEEGA